MLIRDPIYQQLNRKLRELVSRSSKGDRFLTERDISARFEVSRTTANKALAGLVNEGVLEFRKGVGTFVKGDLLHLDLERLISFTAQARSIGKKPSTRILTFTKQQPSELPEAAREALRVDAIERVFYIERVRLADRVPVILERRFVPVRLCPRLSRSDLKGSLYSSLRNQHHITVGAAEQSIRAENLSSADAALLAQRPNAAALVVTGVAITTDGSPLWWERTTYAAGAYVFRNSLVAHGGTRSVPELTE